MKRHLCLVISLFFTLPLIGGWSLPNSGEEITFFDLEVSHGKVVLNWETVESNQMIRAIIERRNGQGSFEFLGGINLRPLKSETTFKFTDTNPSTGELSFYRIRIDFSNGESVYSTEEEIFLLKEKLFVVSPNPVPPGKEMLNFALKAQTIGDVNLKIFDLSGRLMFHKEVENPSFSKVDLPINHLSAGTYFLHIQDQFQTWTHKFIKE